MPAVTPLPFEDESPSCYHSQPMTRRGNNNNKLTVPFSARIATPSAILTEQHVLLRQPMQLQTWQQQQQLQQQAEEISDDDPFRFTVEDILTNRTLKHHFYEFLKENHNEELMDFLIAVESFTTCPPEHARRIADRILQVFVLPNARKALNFSASTRTEFMMDYNMYLNETTDKHRKAEEGDRTRVFKRLRTAVMVQLHEEKIPSFIKSKHHENYVHGSILKRLSILQSDDMLWAKVEQELFSSSNSDCNQTANNNSGGGLMREKKSRRAKLRRVRQYLLHNNNNNKSAATTNNGCGGEVNKTRKTRSLFTILFPRNS